MGARPEVLVRLEVLARPEVLARMGATVRQEFGFNQSSCRTN
jgi:hypothetical protein